MTEKLKLRIFKFCVKLTSNELLRDRSLLLLIAKSHSVGNVDRPVLLDNQILKKSEKSPKNTKTTKNTNKEQK